MTKNKNQHRSGNDLGRNLKQSWKEKNQKTDNQKENDIGDRNGNRERGRAE